MFLTKRSNQHEGKLLRRVKDTMELIKGTEKSLSRTSSSVTRKGNSSLSKEAYPAYPTYPNDTIKLHWPPVTSSTSSTTPTSTTLR